jgi:hypothetical protein
MLKSRMNKKDLAFLIFKEINKLKSASKEKESQLESALKDKQLVLKDLNTLRLQTRQEIEQAQMKCLRLESAVNIRGAMGKEEEGYVIKI